MNDQPMTDQPTGQGPSFAGATIVAFGPAPMSEDARERFVADYEVSEATRILRAYVKPNDGGRATVTFTGRANLDTLWVERGSRAPKIFAEVDQADRDVETVLEIAVIPTGKRLPAESMGRIGSTPDGTHLYLLDAGLWERKRVDSQGDGAVSGGTGGDDQAVGQAGSDEALGGASE